MQVSEWLEIEDEIGDEIGQLEISKCGNTAFILGQEGHSNNISKVFLVKITPLLSLELISQKIIHQKVKSVLIFNETRQGFYLALKIL